MNTQAIINGRIYNVAEKEHIFQLYLWLSHKGYPTNRVCVLVFDSDGERKAIFSEGIEIEGELVTRLGNRD